MNKELISRIATIAVIAGSAASMAVTAANAAPAGCESANRVCVWIDTYYNNFMGWRSGGFALENVSAANNDEMSSWYNNSNYNACWYVHANGSGLSYSMPPYNGSYDVGLWANDAMSSWKGSAC